MRAITFTQDSIAALAQALASAGIPCSDPIVADGGLHRYRMDGDDSPNCWYVLYADGIPAGAFGCWKRGISERWSAKDAKELSAPERATRRRRKRLSPRHEPLRS